MRARGSRIAAGEAVPQRRILFTSYHSLIDPSSGAAISARELLLLLASAGWETRAFYGPLLDFGRRESRLQLLADQGIHPVLDRIAADDASSVSIARFHDGPIRSRLFLSHHERGGPSRPVGLAFLRQFDRVLREFRPEIVLTYGGYWLAEPLQQIAHHHGAKVVFWLCNFAYTGKRLFDGVDLTLVPSRCSQTHYRDVVGIETTAIAPPMNWERVTCTRDPRRRYVTFVNPQPHKGVFVFARLAAHLARRRPDIPLLVVEGRAGINGVARTGVDLSHAANVHVMPNTPDPRDFYRVTHVQLMPSLWRESFGMVAAEAMINGIPVLGTDRGALPDVLGDAGLMFPIAESFTPESKVAPPTYAIRAWVDAIIRLWDDPAYYQQISDRCRARAEAWRPSTLLGHYQEALETVRLRHRETCTIESSLREFSQPSSGVSSWENGSRDGMVSTEAELQEVESVWAGSSGRQPQNVV